MQTKPQSTSAPRAPATGSTRNATLAHAVALLDYANADDCFSDAGLVAVKLDPEEQLRRFLQWLQLTDRGHQPC